MKKTYIVTGGAGFIGSNLVDRLIADGDKVVVIDDFSGGKEENLSQHKDSSDLTIYRRNIVEPLDDIFKNEQPVAVFHLAALARVPLSIQDPRGTNYVNVYGTLNLLDTARAHGVKRFVNYGSSSEYGDPPARPFVENMEMTPLSPYGLQKLAADHYARLYNHIHGMETITLRPFNVFGPRMNYEGAYALLIAKAHQWALTGSNFQINGDGKQTRDFTFVGDVVEATVIAATTTNEDAFGQSFNIGASEEQIVNGVVAKVISNCGKELTPDHGPSFIEPRNTLADINKAKKLLGWEPKANFNEGLKITSDYFISHFS